MFKSQISDPKKTKSNDFCINHPHRPVKRWKAACRYLISATALLFTLFSTLQVSAAGLRTVDYYINHQSNEPIYQNHGLDPTVILHVREVVLEGTEQSVAKGNKALLLVHGSSAPGSVAFDLSHPQGSMMRNLAIMGWDVFTLDIEGFGGSTRAPSMQQPSLFPDETAPVRLDVSVENVNRVVDFIRHMRGVDKVNLLGWSHGSMAEVPAMAIRYPEKLNRIILMGTSWRGWTLSEEKIKAKWAERDRLKFKTAMPATAPKIWKKMGTPSDNLLPGLTDTYIRAALQSDPKSGELGGKVRLPGGRSVYSTETRPHFNASLITVPSLVIRGELDKLASADDNEALLEALSSQHKKLVTIPNTGHLYHWEKTYALTYSAITDFLNEPLE